MLIKHVVWKRIIMYFRPVIQSHFNSGLFNPKLPWLKGSGSLFFLRVYKLFSVQPSNFRQHIIAKHFNSFDFIF